MEEKNQRSPGAPLRIKGSLSTLKLNKEFKRAYYQGKSKATPYFICYRVKNRGQGLRYGLDHLQKGGQRRQPGTTPAVCSGRPSARWSPGWATTSTTYSWPGSGFSPAKSYQVAAMMKGCFKDLEKPSPPKGKNPG